jgi:dipeptidyl aminopeptidase/acylaminoacyl peptidase
MKIILLSLLLMLSCFSSDTFAKEQTKFANLDVFELEWVSQPQLSPNAKQLVFIRNGMDIMSDNPIKRLWLINRDGSGLMKLTDRDVSESNPRWSPDGTRIVFTSKTEHGSEIFMYWVANGKISRLTQLNSSPSNLSWSADGKYIAFSMLVTEESPILVKALKKPIGAKWADKPRVTTRVKHEADGRGFIRPGFNHLFVISAVGVTARQITSGNFHHRGLAEWSTNGQYLFFSSNRHQNWEYDFKNSEIYRVSVKSGETITLTDRNGPDHGAVVSPDGRKIAYLGYDDKIQTYQINHLYTMNVDGSDKKKIPLALDRNISNLAWDKNSSGVYFQYDNHGNGKIGYTSLSGKSKVVAKNLGGVSNSRPYGGGSYTLSDSDIVAYTYGTAKRPSELALTKKGNRNAKLITGLNDDILPFRKLGEVKEIWYKSTFDKRDLQGWIVTPPDYDPTKKYPLIVENHGGPIANYGDRFSVEVQLYAAAGYVVFYPNPRGSTSYGEEFGNLLYHNYPGDDYQDVMDGVDVLIEKGYTTEQQLYVTGGSAGGIMTAWIIGKNNRFQAAAVVKPVMNWISKTLTADNYFYYANSRYPGQPWENMDIYMKYSPISLVGNITTPTLVMVGTADLRTPLSEAKQLYHALKLRKIDTALVEIPGAYHFIAKRPSQQVAKIAHIIAWFEKYKKSH